MGIEQKLKQAIINKNKTSVDECFSDIFNQYYKLCLFVSSSYVDSSDEAEDIAQNVFLNFYNKIINDKTFDIKNIKQYLCTASKNLSIDYNKRLSSNKNILFDENAYSAHNPPVDMISEQLETVWSGLLIEEKDLIIDHLFLDKTFKEVAECSGKRINTIKSQYRRAIIKIRKGLK